MHLGYCILQFCVLAAHLQRLVLQLCTAGLLELCIILERREKPSDEVAQRQSQNEQHLQHFVSHPSSSEGSGLQYPGSSPLELLFFVFQLVAQRLLFLLQLCQTLLQLESQRGVDASGDILGTREKG